MRSPSRCSQYATGSASAGSSGSDNRPPQMPAGGRREQHPAVRVQHQQRGAALGQRLAGARRRQGGDAVLPQRDAQVGDRAAIVPLAARPGARADRRTHVHLRLDVGGDPSLGQQFIGLLPEPFLDAGRAGETFDAERAAEQALDVAIEDRRPRPEAEHRDRVGRRPADAGQRGDALRIVRKRAAVPGQQDLRAAVQVARPGVVAEPAP